MLTLLALAAEAAPVKIAAVTAKSSYNANGVSYPADAVKDGKAMTPWFEGDPGSGVGSWIEVDLGDGAGLSASATRYASGIGLTVGSTGGGFVGGVTVAYGGTVTIRLAAIGGSFSGGRVRVRAVWTPRTIPSA
jgi:hypothetical protein